MSPLRSSNFNGENGCSGNQTNQDPSWASRRFQTPPRGAQGWRDSYQDYSHLQGWTTVVYAPDHLSATVTVNPVVKRQAGVTDTISFVFGGGAPSQDPTFHASSTNNTAPLAVEIRASPGGLAIQLEDVRSSHALPRL